MKYGAAGIVAVGALVVYLARAFFRWVKKREPEDREVAVIKLCGLLIALVGAVLLFISERK